jgi:hypothetical protein
MNTANIIAIVAAVVSFGSMCAAIASAATARANARIAEQAKQQALKAATLERRAKAIDHLRNALGDIENDGPVKGDTVNNVSKAMRLSELVFNNEIQAEVAKAHAKTQGLHHQRMAHEEAHHPGPIPPNEQLLQETRALREDLKDLIGRMNQEAALGR